jgi:hypothetical protein
MNLISKFLDDISSRLINVVSKGIHKSGIDDAENTTFGKMKNFVNESDGHFIIENEQRRKEAYTLKASDGLNIGNDGGAPPGIINPIKYTTIKKALNIDSRFRPNYYNTSSCDQQINLPYRFENVINMRLASIELPLTYHTISKANGNNIFILNWEVSPGSTTYNNSMVVVIPDGNYITKLNANSGLSSIESVMNAALQNPNNKMHYGTNMSLDTKFNLIYTVDATSGRSIFAIDASNSSVPTTQYQIVWAINADGSPAVNENISFFLGWMLGYRVNMYVSKATPSLISPAVISEGICYMKGPSYIFVAIDDYTNSVNNYYISAYSDSINNRNIIARINLGAIQQTNGSYQTGEDDGFSTQVNRSRNYFGPVNIEKLKITLYDEYGRILNLNNMDWSCALMFECLYGG